MEEVTHVPAGQCAVFGDLAHAILVALPEQLHAYYSKDEHDDGQHQCQVAQSPDGVPNNFDQGVKRGPGLGQLEDSQLKAGGTNYSCRFARLFAPSAFQCTENVLTSRNVRRTDMPPALDRVSSIKLNVTIMPSKMFHPSWK